MKFRLSSWRVVPKSNWRIICRNHYIASQGQLHSTTKPSFDKLNAKLEFPLKGSGLSHTSTPDFSDTGSGRVPPSTLSDPTSATKPPRKFKARKAAMTLTPAAVSRLKELLNQPEPKLIKVGVKRKGCSGLAYNLDYVDQSSAFDEVVSQDGVQILIDSNALFSIIGSEMDWIEDKLQQKFVFRNPNISITTHFRPLMDYCANFFGSYKLAYTNLDSLSPKRSNAGAASHSWYKMRK